MSLRRASNTAADLILGNTALPPEHRDYYVAGPQGPTPGPDKAPRR